MINKFKLILSLIAWRGRKQAVFLLMMIILTAILDAIGIASIMPFVAVLANPDLIQDNSFFYDYVMKLDNSKWYIFKFEGKYIGVVWDTKLNR